MGSIIGGVIGGVGSLIGGNQAAKAQKNAAAMQQAQAAKTESYIPGAKVDALTGYNYLNNNEANQLAQQNANGAYQPLNQTQQSQAQLLGQAPITDQTNNGFNNYLNSTGYKFQLGQGMDAISGSASARGLLNSGATAKSLQGYGQGLASQSFNNYLGQLNTLGQGLGSTIDRGLGAANQVGAAGTSGGGNAANVTASLMGAANNQVNGAANQIAGAGESKGTSTAQAFNDIGGSVAGGGGGQFVNFFKGL